MKKKKNLTLSALALGVGLFCGASALTAPMAFAETKALAPVAQQVVTINNGTEPETLDPQKASGVPEAAILRQLLEGLTNTDPNGNTIPGVASSWETTDNKTWVFHLRDAKWSNGDPVTAEDFVYSFQRLVDPQTASPYGSYLGDSKVLNAEAITNGEMKPETLGVKAIDDKTLEIQLSEPVPYFADTLIHTSVKPVHKATVEKYGDKWTAPENFVSNGAYQLKSWRVNDKIVLERNSQYYNNDNTTINEVTLLPISSETTDVSRYKAGDVDMTASVPSEQFKALKKELGDQVKISPMLCTYYYEFNTQKAPFNDARVRRALAVVLDRDVITDKVLGQGQTPAYQFSPVDIKGVDEAHPDWREWTKPERIAYAKKLLNEAGYDEKHPLEFELLYNSSESHKKIAIAVNSLFKQSLGFVNVKLINKEWKTYLDARRTGDTQMARAGWCADYNEASSFLNTLKSSNGNNYGKYANKTYDEVMDDTLKPGLTDDQRRALYDKAEAILDQEQPLINVYHYVGVRLVKPYVEGYSTVDPVEGWQVKDWKILAH